jgi:hypothetical protein
MRGEVKALSQRNILHLGPPSSFRRSSVPVERDKQRSISCGEFRVVIWGEKANDLCVCMPSFCGERLIRVSSAVASRTWRVRIRNCRDLFSFHNSTMWLSSAASRFSSLLGLGKCSADAHCNQRERLTFWSANQCPL